MKSINELLLEQGYRIYMCSIDRRYVSFVQEENYSINVICIYDERTQTSTRAQMESFLTVHRERLSYGRDKDIHFLRLVCTTERGVGMVGPAADNATAYGQAMSGSDPENMQQDAELSGQARPAGTAWIEDVWYLIDDACTQSWRLFVPQTAVQDYYGLRAHLERHVAANGVEIALPEISESLAVQTRAKIDRLPMQPDVAKEKLKEGASRMSSQAPWVTMALVILCAIMYFFEEHSVFNVDDYVIATGILTDPGQWYRLLTSVFLHGSMEHLVNNMLVLYAVGSYMEPKLGRFVYTTVFFLSGIGGGIFSVWYHTVHGYNYQALGASGAVYGMIAATIAYMLLNREFQKRQYYYRIGIALLLLFYSSKTDGGIDIYSHIGGFVSGLIVAGLLCIMTWKRMHRRTNA